MSPLTPDQECLRACVQELDILGQQVEDRLKPHKDETKRIPFDLTRDFIFQYGDMKPQVRTFQNGAEDLFLSKPHFSVVTGPVLAGQVSPTNPVDMIRTPAGLMPGGQQVTRPFDFFWNYTIGSQGEKYGSPVNDLQWLSRTSLGNRQRWLPLTFQKPLILKAGDSISWTVKPAMFTMAPVTSGGAIQRTYVVNMTMTGYRTGRMAESQFDPDFRPRYRKDRA